MSPAGDVSIRCALAAVLLSGCAVHPAPVAATDPANAAAPTGRLADAPATLRPGVVDYAAPAAKTEPAPAPEHHHHHAP